MKKAIFSIALLVSIGNVCAEQSPFEGFYGVLNLDNVSPNTNVIARDSNSKLMKFDGVGQPSWSGSIQAAYGIALDNNIVTTLGGSYVIGDIKAGGFEVSSVNYGIKLNNIASVYLEQGLQINDKSLGYIKASYDTAKGTLTAGDNSNYSSKPVRGLGSGIGIRTSLSKNSFVQVEFKQVVYRSVDLGDGGTYTPKRSTGSVGFGMKF